VGSRNENPKYTGLAHLFEHMMFKGTKAYPDGKFDKLLEAAGVEGENAYTTQDHTTYIQELPKERLDLIIELESDRMTNLIVDEKSFATEREVVQNERRWRNENSPDGTLYQEIFTQAYSTHPYHWPVIGYEEDLNRMSAQDARIFYQQYYAPNHAIIIVCGDVKASEVFSKIKKAYGSLRPSLVANPVIPMDAPFEGPKHQQLALNIQVEKIYAAYPIPAGTHADATVLDLLAEILGGGKSSRLQRSLVNTGIAKAVEVYSRDSLDPGLFIIGADLQAGKKATHAEAQILRDIEHISKHGVTKEELTRAKNRIQFGFYSALEENTSRASLLGKFEILENDYSRALNRLNQSKMVTSEDIKTVINTYLKANLRTVVTGVPK
jgi:zinc protease